MSISAIGSSVQLPQIKAPTAAAPPPAPPAAPKAASTDNDGDSDHGAVDIKV